MDNRVATLGIIVEDENSIIKLNDILHEYRDIIISRMGVPYDKRKINIICLIVDGNSDRINSLSGKLGATQGLASKVCYFQLG